MSETMAAPEVTGPVTGGAHGRPATTTSPVTAPALAAAGYVEEEFHFGGTARAYATADGTALTPDGRWTVEPAAEAAYRTRLLVRRPPAERFNGTVYVEWLNVTSGVDLDGSFHIADEELLRGYAWVGVSAQAVSVDGPADPTAANPAAAGLRAWDPERYGELAHPGDAYSYDIFGQAAAALRGTDAVRPLGDLVPREVIGLGVSQSAFRLTTYIDALHLRDRAYDGYLVHERGDAGAPLSQAPLPDLAPPSPTLIRTDLDVPVLQWQSESDVQYLLFHRARQPATDGIRTWELAGASHADLYWYERFAASRERDYPGFGPTLCDLPFNDGVARYVFRAAIRALAAWTRGTGPAPAQSDPVVTSPDGEIVRDALGNALGGIRTPMLEVPVARLSAENTPAPCYLFGSTVALAPDVLAARYPTRAEYVERFRAATEDAVAAGWLLAEDAPGLIAEAQARAAGLPG